MEKPPPRSSETDVEFTLSGARDLKNTKLFGKMSPCAVVTVMNTNLTQVSNPAASGGTSPTWDQTFLFQVPDVILQSSPALKVEIFASSEMDKSLGVVAIPLNKAVAKYHEPHSATLGVNRKRKIRGFLNFSLKCGRTSFAPPKGTPEYDAFITRLLPPPPPIKPPITYAAPGSHPPYYQPPPPPYGYSQAGHSAVPSYPPAVAPGYPAAYPYPPPYGYPPQYGYPPSGYSGQHQVVVVEQRRQRGMGGMGGAGVGLMAGAAGGLLLGAALSDFGGCGGGGCGGF